MEIHVDDGVLGSGENESMTAEMQGHIFRNTVTLKKIKPQRNAYGSYYLHKGKKANETVCCIVSIPI